MLSRGYSPDRQQEHAKRHFDNANKTLCYEQHVATQERIQGIYATSVSEHVEAYAQPVQAQHKERNSDTSLAFCYPFPCKVQAFSQAPPHVDQLICADHDTLVVALGLRLSIYKGMVLVLQPGHTGHHVTCTLTHEGAVCRAKTAVGNVMVLRYCANQP